MRLGLVVHPSRDIEAPFGDLLSWADERGDEVVQIPIDGQDRRVADTGRPQDCDLLVSIGGDGTMLAAIRAAVPAQRPVLGIACGSLGALTAVPPDGVTEALERFGAGEWYRRSLPALSIDRPGSEGLFAINDVVVIRAGIGQVRTSIHVDGALYARVAGDGCIVSTQVGSSAYAIAAGGPLLAPGTDAFLLTPLPTHGGSCPPLVLGAQAELGLKAEVGIGGGRLEIDGQIAGAHDGALTVTLRPDVATLVAFEDQEAPLAGLRRRRVIVDSPRLVAEERRRHADGDR
ncbi:MAG: NAD(+)/NADH kinase [Solirubrobacteraceae bacterium]